MLFKLFLNLGLVTYLASPALAAETVIITPNLDDSMTAELDARSNGCPAESYRTTVSPDSKQLRLDYSQLTADANFPNRYDVANCNVSLHVNVPRGYQVAFSSVRQNGSAYGTDSNSAGAVRIDTTTDYARYPVEVTNRRQVGPFNGDYSFIDQVPYWDLQWTECNAQRSQFNIRTQLTAEANQIFARFRFAGSLANRNQTSQLWRIDWRLCGGGTPPPDPRDRWAGQCKTVLETIEGIKVRDHWGRAYGTTQADALYNALDASLEICEDDRNNSERFQCTPDRSSCDAYEEN